MNIQKYLNRIGYNESLEPTLKVLSSLQTAHLFSVPFENLDIHNNIKINLDNSFDKIVNRKRGGFCYELNGLFYLLLKEIGFNAKLVSARVYQGEKGFGDEFDHMAIIVRIDIDDYLVDVGFGDFSYSPLKIILNKEIVDPRSSFMIEKYDKEYNIVKQKSDDGSFIPKYLFSEKKREIKDFNEMCVFHQTSEESHFTQNKICSLPVINGRITLSGNTLISSINGSIETLELKTDNEIKKVLKDYFKIEL